jgi:RimJ/RimL family protein N-acetyltransferase
MGTRPRPDVRRGSDPEVADDVVSEERAVTLRDGSRALLRPIRPDDKWRIAEGLKLLSPRSRYLRFHADIESFSDEQLAYLTEVDHHDHEAWVALDPDDVDSPGLGVARYVRSDEDPTVAEAAVTVIDTAHGRGVGTALLRALAASAIDNGIHTFRNYVLADNEAMLEVFDLVGAQRREVEPGLLQVDVALPDDPSLLPAPGISELFRELARGLLPPVIWRYPWNALLRHGPREWLRAGRRDAEDDPSADQTAGEDDRAVGADEPAGGDEPATQADAPTAEGVQPPTEGDEPATGEPGGPARSGPRSDQR